jgi:hypothetical protein
MDHAVNRNKKQTGIIQSKKNIKSKLFIKKYRSKNYKQQKLPQFESKY